jgi:hypothetical protein
MSTKGGNSMKKSISNPVIWSLVLLAVVPLWAVSSEPNTSPVFKQEELDQFLAPIAIYPDSLLSQILMASTYPLEVVQADRWARQNKDISGDALAAALEERTWDPSVKSLVNFPQVLTMMSEKLDWTQKLGDAFLAQQKDVMDTVQKLRNKAQEQGVLKTTEEQVVKKVEPDIIAIESADPQVIYVPTYNPAVVYGPWWYPAYPPYYYYPPGYIPRATPYSFGAGVAVGAAWGYAWGNCNWHSGDVGINVNQNLNFNRNINRGQYAQLYQNRGQLGQGGTGIWQHNPADRRGVPYRDQATAQKFNRASTPDAVRSREAYRGRAEQGRQELARGDADRFKGRPDVGQRGDFQARDRGGTRDIGGRDSSSRGGAFQDMDRGSSARNFSSRGNASRQSMSRPMGGGGGGGRGRR